MSVSRSAVIVVGVSFIVLLIGWPRSWRIRALIVMPFAVVGLRLAVPGLVGTLVSLFRNLLNDPSISGRTSDYAVLFDVIGDNPLLGRGLFTFVPRYYRIVDNQYLVFAVELGIIGLLVMMAFLAVSFFQSFAAHRRARESTSRDVSLAVSAAVAGVLVSFVTFDALGFPMAAGLMMLLVGLAGACWRLATVEDPLSPYRPHQERVDVAH